MEFKNTFENNDLWNLIDELNSTIFSNETWINNEFYKIPEITYSYIKNDTWNIINKTLFVDLVWMNVSYFEELQNDIDKKQYIESFAEKLKEKINKQIEDIQKYIEKLNNIDSWNDKVLNAKKEIILWSLKENIYYLQLALEWLDFEIEKALYWVYFKTGKKYLSDEDRVKKLQKIDELNIKIFWEKISLNQEYIHWVLDYLATKYDDYKNQLEKWKISEDRLLTEEEKERYNYYISKIQALSPEYKAKIKNKPDWVIDKRFFELNLDISQVKDVLNHNLIAIDKQTWNMPLRAYFDKNISAFTDTARWLGIPKNQKNKSKKLYDVLRLWLHENEKHLVSEISQQTLIWNIKGAWYLEAEEWMAMLAEELFQFGENLLKDKVDKDWNKVKIIDINKISYVQSFAKTMMEEVLSDEEFYDFLYLQNKIEPDKMTVLDRYLRFKRTWFQRKDITYTTWKIKAAKYINDIILWNIDWNLEDLYSWKVWFKDLDKISLIKKNAENSWIKLPKNLLFADATYYWVTQREKWEKITKEGFKNYLIKKYPFLKSLIDEKIDTIKFWFKKQLLWAIDNIFTEIQVDNLRKATRKKSKRILN